MANDTELADGPRVIMSHDSCGMILMLFAICCNTNTHATQYTVENFYDGNINIWDTPPLSTLLIQEVITRY